ncbi:uncharacterized protein [Musca autumnalis]|uniref:uncharacterized protein n=1 Tax=Musca autumnalis TaxID=221902 RepID=UPI003CF70037
MVEEVSESIAKLTTKRIQWSGSQRRKYKRNQAKLKRQQQRDASQGTKDTPSTSSEAAKRTRSPEEQNTAKPSKKKKSFPPSSAQDKSHQDPNKGDYIKNPSRETGEVSSDTKRVSATSEPSGTAGDSTKKTKTIQKRKMDVETGTEPPSTYAKVAKRYFRDDLCYAVIDTSKGSGRLHKDHLLEIEKLINDKLLEQILKGRVSIKIDCCEPWRDILLCHLDPHTNSAALGGVVSSIATPWEGGRLKLVRKDEIPHLTKASVYIKGYGCKLETERILEVLGVQNETLEVKRWEVFHREEKEDGTLLVVGIDDLSLAGLAKTKGKAYFVSNSVYFKIGKARVGDEENAKSTTQEVKPTNSTKEGGADEQISASQEANLLEDQ